MNTPRVVRVAVTNNFNCTPKEYAQLDEFQMKNPNDFFFINSNIKTPNLLAINDHPYPAVITLNPDLVIMDNLVQRLYDIASDKVAFVRIKYIPGWDSIIDLINRVSKTHKVVITMQRFLARMNMTPLVPLYQDHYEWLCSRWRLNQRAMLSLDKLISPISNVSICDRKGLGCLGCGLCSSLPTGKDIPLYSLNLSTSGICPYNCVDCYAKIMQKLLKTWGHPLIHFDKIMRNKKQKGDMAHIKQQKQAA